MKKKKKKILIIKTGSRCQGALHNSREREKNLTNCLVDLSEQKGKSARKILTLGRKRIEGNVLMCKYVCVSSASAFNCSCVCVCMCVTFSKSLTTEIDSSTNQ